jgi:hypothetical protein
MHFKDCIAPTSSWKGDLKAKVKMCLPNDFHIPILWPFLSLFFGPVHSSNKSRIWKTKKPKIGRIGSFRFIHGKNRISSEIPDFA